MAALSIIPKELRAKISRLQAELASLQESFDDFTLTTDDLNAIDDGQRDFELGQTRRL